MRKSTHFSTILLLFIVLTAFNADNLPKVFTDRLDRAKMIFTAPDGYTSVPIVANGQMHYEYALKYTGKNFEIRYAIAPLDSLFIQYETMKKNAAPGSNSIGPNKLYSAAFMATIMNLSGGNMPHIREFPKDAVSNEFNADWGATSVFHVTGAFGQGYDTCVAVAIHKDDLGDAYIFYLSDNPNDLQNLVAPYFYALKFK